MPIGTPRTPTPQTWRRQFIKGAPGEIPVQTQVATPTSIFPATWQVGAVFSGPVTVAVGALGAGVRSTITATIPLTRSLPGAISTASGVVYGAVGSTQTSIFPQSITLAANQVGIIIASASLGFATGATAVGALPLVGLPQIGIAYSLGSPGAQLTSTGAVAQLNGPNSWYSPTLIITLPLYAPAGTGAGTLVLNVSAVLYGQQN